MRNTKFFLAAAAVFASTPAFAAGDNMVVTANVANACSFNAADTTVSASTIRAGGSTTGNVGIWCTNGYTVTVTASSTNSFALSNGTDSIAYSLTRDGTTAFSGQSFTGSASASFSNLPYSLDFAAQNPPAGTYTDTITFSVTP
jgi:spore coat protein U-like protein